MKKLIKIPLLLLFFYMVYTAGSCASGRKTQKSDTQTTSTVNKKDSLSVNQQKMVIAKRNEARFSKSKTDNSKKTVKQKDTEVTTDGYDVLKVQTDAKDYFPIGFVRINDSVLLAPKKTHRKQSENKHVDETSTAVKEKIDTSETSTNTAQATQSTVTTQVDSTGTAKKTESSSNTSFRLSSFWWLLLIIPIVVFRNKLRSFAGLK